MVIDTAMGHFFDRQMVFLVLVDIVTHYCSFRFLGILSGARFAKKSFQLLHLNGARIHLPHAIVVRLHAHKINVVTLAPETVVTV